MIAPSRASRVVLPNPNETRTSNLSIPPRNSSLLNRKSSAAQSRFSKRSTVKRNLYLPRHIEGKFSLEETKILKKKLKQSDTACAIISCFGVLITWIENEIFFNNGNESSIGCHVLRGFVSLSCLVTHYLIYNHYSLVLEILKARKIIYSGATIRSSNMLPGFLVESFINWIHCPPFVDYIHSNDQNGIKFDISFDAYISILMFGRLYIFFRLFDHYTFWTGDRSVRVCRINGFIPDSQFAIRAYLKYKAFLMLGLSLGLSILFFGLIMRTLERPYFSLKRANNFDTIYNSFWCVIVSMATIGYGDIYPVTLQGRYASFT